MEARLSDLLPFVSLGQPCICIVSAATFFTSLDRSILAVNDSDGLRRVVLTVAADEDDWTLFLVLGLRYVVGPP